MIKQFNTMLPEELVEEFREYARVNGRSMAKQLEWELRKVLAK